MVLNGLKCKTRTSVYGDKAAAGGSHRVQEPHGAVKGWMKKFRER